MLFSDGRVGETEADRNSGRCIVLYTDEVRHRWVAK